MWSESVALLRNMITTQTTVSLSDYVKLKIGPETGRGHTGYYDTLLSASGKVVTPEQARMIKGGIDAIANAVKLDGRYSLRGESGQRYTIEQPSTLIDLAVTLQPYVGQNLGVEQIISEITRDLRQRSS